MRRSASPPRADAAGMPIETSWFVELQRRVQEQERATAAMKKEREKDAEAVRCLMDLVEDTMPTADVHALAARATAQVEASAAGWRTALSAVEAEVVTLAGRVQSLERSRREADHSPAMLQVPMQPRPGPPSQLGALPQPGPPPRPESPQQSAAAAPMPDHSVALRTLADSVHDLDRRLERASGNITDINIRLLSGVAPMAAAAETPLDGSAVEGRLRAVETAVERAVVLIERRVEGICRKELALARLQWEQGVNEHGAAESTQSHTNHGLLTERIDKVVQQQEELVHEARTQRHELSRLEQNGASTVAKVEALVTDLAAVAAHKSGREDAQAAELSSFRENLTQLER
jgi:hypothetical protein